MLVVDVKLTCLMQKANGCVKAQSIKLTDGLTCVKYSSKHIIRSWQSEDAIRKKERKGVLHVLLAPYNRHRVCIAYSISIAGKTILKGASEVYNIK